MTDSNPSTETHAGFVAVIGAPNAGKSTLVNRLVGAKVSIVTQKVQTTRFPVRGVAIAGAAQIVLVDTPGIFKPKRRLDRAMVESAWGGAEDADAVVHLVDVAAEIAVQSGDSAPADRQVGRRRGSDCRAPEDRSAPRRSLRSTRSTACNARTCWRSPRRCSPPASMMRCS